MQSCQKKLPITSLIILKEYKVKASFRRTIISHFGPESTSVLAPFIPQHIPSSHFLKRQKKHLPTSGIGCPQNASLEALSPVCGTGLPHGVVIRQPIAFFTERIVDSIRIVMMAEMFFKGLFLPIILTTTDIYLVYSRLSTSLNRKGCFKPSGIWKTPKSGKQHLSSSRIDRTPKHLIQSI